LGSNRLIRRDRENTGNVVDEAAPVSGRSDKTLQPSISQKLPSEPIEQDIERLPGSTRRLAAQLMLPLPIQSLWEVLTDYEQLTQFIPNLESSRILNRNGSTVLLEQVGCQKFVGLRFSASVRLELEERREQGVLRFRMVAGDFRRFEGSWIVCLDPRGIRVRYELLVQACRGMPIALIEQRLRDDLATNLRAVALEALKREARKQEDQKFQPQTIKA
jgi:ribosome-associated toxin RatA of RatAB toxin-antitoxin module